MSKYRVALWRTPLSSCSEAEYPIEATDATAAAKAAMIQHGSSEMGVIIVMAEKEQVSFFSTRLTDGMISYDRISISPRFASEPFDWHRPSNMHKMAGPPTTKSDWERLAAETDSTITEQEIKQFLLDMGAKVGREREYILISHPKLEKAAPTLKDAFLLLVGELMLEGQARPQYRLKRSYQFPMAVWEDIITEKFIAGWIVNVVGSKQLYGVVRYSPHGDDVAWIESHDHFGQDRKKAKEWVCMEMMKLAEEQEK